MDRLPLPSTASGEPPFPSVNASTLPTTSTTVIPMNPRPMRPVASEFDSGDRVFQRHRRHRAPCRSFPPAGSDSPSSGRVFRESPDAPENLSKETPRQVALGQLAVGSVGNISTLRGPTTLPIGGWCPGTPFARRRTGALNAINRYRMGRRHDAERRQTHDPEQPRPCQSSLFRAQRYPPTERDRPRQR
jgi:hypothetical protein